MNATGLSQTMKGYLPGVRETLSCLIALTVWLTITILFIGFRIEHIFIALLVCGLFFVTCATRKFLIAILPFIVFGISYDWMNLLPNYMVNPVDTDGLYGLEKSLFGIFYGESILTPNEFFALNTHPVFDFLSGFFYLCWVPVPLIFGFYLYFSGKTELYLHFALVFLFVNLLGFACYYIHPAAPPWYVALHGFEAVPGTPGNVAGLGAFDEMTGLGIFDALYGRNANVFAALPSLHSAYPFIAMVYAMRKNVPVAWKIVTIVVAVGIWFGAVYSSHHYIIDVTCGVILSAAGILFFEKVLMLSRHFRRFLNSYKSYIAIK